MCNSLHPAPILDKRSSKLNVGGFKKWTDKAPGPDLKAVQDTGIL